MSVINTDREARSRARGHIRSGEETAATLGVSIVVFRPDLELLRTTLMSLRRAVACARRCGALTSVVVWVVDNGSPDEVAVDQVVTELARCEGVWVEIIRGHGNVGYGRGHNLAIREARSEFHLVLNPDVELDETSLLHAATFMEEHPDVGALTPSAVDEAGAKQYLCREYPSLWVLFLRAFAPSPLKRRYEHRLAAYEMRERIRGETVKGVPTASGCFMFARHELLRQLGGFSDRYFMYFEDTDLSIRIARESTIAYVPTVRIVHWGGDASRKGMRHVLMFSRSALTFFRTHRWKLV